MFTSTARRQLSLMLVAEFFFHISEFILAISIHGKESFTKKSYCIISKQYVTEIGYTVLEYFVEIFLFPQVKENWWICYLGVAMVVVGELVRKVAIVTAGNAFTLVLRTRRDERHKLVTHGIYGFMRHPGYCGCLMWAVGNQMILCNPVSSIAIGIIVWRFFHKRILEEERLLREFFGSSYDEYAKRVPSGVPFVR